MLSKKRERKAMAAIEEFNLFWSDDLDGTPDASAFKPANSTSYQAFEDVLEQAKTPPNAKDKHPWIEADGLLSRRGIFKCSTNGETTGKADPDRAHIVTEGSFSEHFVTEALGWTSAN
jgi:hypothetical protein